MEEIKVGDYVRNDKGRIGKILSIDEDGWIETTLSVGNVIPIKSLKIKSSIKDLIESGDIVIYQVKGLENVINIDIVKSHIDIRTMQYKLRIATYSLENINILEILTKEQFNNNSYKVKEV